MCPCETVGMGGEKLGEATMIGDQPSWDAVLSVLKPGQSLATWVVGHPSMMVVGDSIW